MKLPILAIILGLVIPVLSQVHSPPPVSHASLTQATATPPPSFPPGAWPTPKPSPTDSSDPAARALLLRSDEVMNALTSMRIEGADLWRNAPAEPPRARVDYDFVAPDRAKWRYESKEGIFEAICIGRDYWTRQDAGSWKLERLEDPCEAPSFAHFLETDSDWRGAARDITFKGQEALASGPAWVVGYRLPEASEEGWYDTFVTEWVDQRTTRLLREERWNSDPFGCAGRCLGRLEYSRFDEVIEIQAPVPSSGSSPSFRVFTPWVAP